MRIGVAGVGRIGAFHASVLAGLDGVEEILLADASPERAVQVARALSDNSGAGGRRAPRISAAAEPDDLLVGGLDGLVVAAGTDAHPGLICAGVEAGVPVFCEKPVAGELGQILQVAERVGRSDVAVQVGFQRRFDAGFGAAREAVSTGKLGWVHTMWACTFDPAPPPAEYIATSGGLFRDCSVHDIDALRWVSGREVVEVAASGANRGASFFAEYGDVDTAGALLRLDDGTLAVIGATRYNAAGYDVRLEVFGADSTVAVGLDERSPLSSVESGIAWPSGRPYRDFLDRFAPAYTAELAAFLEVASGRRPSPCTVADSLETAYVAEACELARAQRRWVGVAEVKR